jgi:ATP-dependent Clp protease ATP-binding subunit ClpA
VASFKNAILIMTSNVGSDIIAREASLGFIGGDKEKNQKENLRDKVLTSLKESFRPEFLNRIDEIIIFNYLSKPEIKEITDLEFEKVVKRLFKKNINLEIMEDVKKLIAEEGFDPNLGARPLKRVIQRKVLDPLSTKIVSGEIREGDRVKVDLKAGQIVFQGSGSLLKAKKLRRQKVGVSS